MDKQLINKIKIIEWNIQGSAALPWNTNYEIKNNIVDKIIQQEADIIVLNEFVISKGWDYFQQQLKENNYIWFMTNTTSKNGILICIKEKLIDMNKIVKRIYKEECILSENNGCNILRIKLPLINGKNLIVIGIRMETGGEKTLQEQYDFERKIFDTKLIPMITEIDDMDDMIVCGDFNNARCLGDLSKKFNIRDYKNKNHKKLAQCNFNLNIIKDKFVDDLGFKMADMGKGNKGIPTHKNYFPDDHIFVRGFGFIPEYCDTVKVEGLSDHDILYAYVKTN